MKFTCTLSGAYGYSGYVYYRKDHLGNNREVWRAGKPGGASATTLQRTWYYPSGLPWNYTLGLGAGIQSYKYNSKEFIEMHGFDSYDYSARMMYPALGGRFMTIDPMAEKYYSISPYVYCLDNPVTFVDPDGKAVRVADFVSFNVLLSSLPQESRNLIKLNNNNFIDINSVKAAYAKFSNSGNLQALSKIVSDERIVDFYATTRNYEYINAETGGNGTFKFQEPIKKNVFQEMMNEFSGTPQQKEQYAQHLISVGIIDVEDVTGNFGATLRPTNAQDHYPGGQISKSNNFEVYVNPVGTSLTEQAKSVGHELFGHLYFWFLNKNPRHETPTSNPLLNRQIIDREEESRLNSQY